MWGAGFPDLSPIVSSNLGHLFRCSGHFRLMVHLETRDVLVVAREEVLNFRDWVGAPPCSLGFRCGQVSVGVE